MSTLLPALWSFAYCSDAGKGFGEPPDVFRLSLALTALGETQ